MRAFIAAIKAKLGHPPGSVWLKIKAFEHEFGTYHEVVCEYDSEDEVGRDYALRCESESPSTWEEAKIGWTDEYTWTQLS